MTASTPDPVSAQDPPARPAGETPPQQQHSMLLVWPMAGMLFLVIADHQIMQPILPQVCNGYGISQEWAPAVTGSYSIAAALSALLLGPWSDRMGRAKLIRFFAFGFAIANLLCGLATNVWMLLGARIVAGIFGGTLGSTTNAYIGDLFTGERRTRAMGYYSLGFPVAIVIAVPIGAKVGGGFGWQTVCYSLALMSFLMAMFTLRYPHIHIPRVAKTLLREYWEMIEVVFHPRGWPFFLSFFLIMCTFFGYVVNMSIWLVNNQGMDNTQNDYLSWMFLCGGVGSILGALMFRVLIKFSGKTELLLSSALFSGCMVYLLLSRPPMENHIILFSLFFLSHFSGSLRRPLAGLIAVDIAPEHLRGRFLAMLNITISFSFAAAAGWTKLVLTYPDHKGDLLIGMDRMALCIIAGTLLAIPSLMRVRTELRRVAALGPPEPVEDQVEEEMEVRPGWDQAAAKPASPAEPEEKK